MPFLVTECSKRTLIEHRILELIKSIFDYLTDVLEDQTGHIQPDQRQGWPISLANCTGFAASA